MPAREPNTAQRIVGHRSPRPWLSAAALLSSTQRWAGLFLAASTPFFLYWFDLSLRDATGFAAARDWFQSGWGRLWLAAGLWAFALHFAAGVRLLLADLGLGLGRELSRRSAWAANLFPWVILVVIVLGWWS